MERTLLLRKQEKALESLLSLRERTTAANLKDMEKSKASVLTDLIDIRAQLAKLSGSDVASPVVRQRKLLDTVAQKKQPREPKQNAAEERKAAMEYEKELKAVRSELEKSRGTAEAKESNTALFSAAVSSGDIDFIKLCFEEGLFEDANFPLDQEGTTPMHKAAYSSQIDVIKLLAEKADVNAQNKKGTTPLMMAKSLEVAKCLVEELKSNLNLVNNFQKTALHVTAYTGDLDFVRLLVENGAEVSKMDDQGRTPLFYAIVRGHYELVVYLSDFLDVEQIQKTDKQGVSALEFAKRSNNFEIARYLETKIRSTTRK